MADDPDEAALDALLHEARAQTPPTELTQRVLVDADTVLTTAGPVAPVRSGTGQRGPGFLAGLLDGIGGWGGLTGVTAAGLVGLAIGLSAPGMLDTVTGAGGLSLGLGADTAGAGWAPDFTELALEDGDV